MKHKNDSAFTFLMKVALLLAVSLGLCLGFSCFPNVDTNSACFSDFSVSLIVFAFFQFLTYALFHSFVNSADIFLRLLYIFIKSVFLSFLLRFCIDFSFYDYGLLTVLVMDILFLAFAMSNLSRMRYHIR